MRGALRRLCRPLPLALMAALALAAALLAWWQWPLRHLRRGEAALAARDYDQAREHLGRYLASRPDDPRARLLAARAARQLGEYHEAYEHLARCRGLAEAVAAERELIAVRRGEEPSPELRRRAEGDDELALVILEGTIQYDIDTYRLRQAQRGLTHYLECRPDDLHALLARGYVWERFLSFADALTDYRRAVAAHPDSERARLKLAEALLLAGTPEEALEQYQWLDDRRPGRREILLGLARCHRRRGELERARELLTDLARDAPTDGEILWERGQVELDEGRPVDAERWLRDATHARPHDRRIAYSLSRCLLALGRDGEAAQVSARVGRLDADLRELERVRQAVIQRPHDAALRCEGGLLFLRNGERQEGLKWLRLALRLDPGCEAARRALAQAEEGGP